MIANYFTNHCLLGTYDLDQGTENGTDVHALQERKVEEGTTKMGQNNCFQYENSQSSIEKLAQNTSSEPANPSSS